MALDQLDVGFFRKSTFLIMVLGVGFNDIPGKGTVWDCRFGTGGPANATASLSACGCVLESVVVSLVGACPSKACGSEEACGEEALACFLAGDIVDSGVGCLAGDWSSPWDSLVAGVT